MTHDRSLLNNLLGYRIRCVRIKALSYKDQLTNIKDATVYFNRFPAKCIPKSF